MEVWILRGTDPETLEEKINKQLEEVEKVKSLFHTPTVQYQTAAVPQMRGDKVTGYKVEYSAMVAVEVKPLFREAKVAAGREETTKTAIPAEETITPNSLANGMLQFLLDSGIVASACVTDETEKMFAKHIKEELDGITIGETPEILRDWEAAQNAVNDMLSKYAPGGYMGKIIYPLLTPLKERLEAGERTPDLYNAIVEATR